MTDEEIVKAGLTGKPHIDSVLLSIFNLSDEDQELVMEAAANIAKQQMREALIRIRNISL